MGDLIVEDRPSGRWIFFNRPEQLNTLLEIDLRAAIAAVEDAAADGTPIVFSGVGDRAFCAGMNLDLFISLVDEPETTRERLGLVRTLLDIVRNAEVVTVAAINGHCLGAAFELALACDFRIAGPDALMGLPEMKLGLPCILDSAVLHQYVGAGLAKEMILTGRVYPASALAERDTVTLVADGGDLTTQVTELLSSFEGISAIGIASQKRLFRAWQNMPLDQANDFSMDEISRVFADPDTGERILAYNQELRGRRAKA
jgi:enoyl-CoA hydratase